MVEVFGNKSNVGDWIIRAGALQLIREVISAETDAKIIDELSKQKIKIGGPGIIRDSFERFYSNDEVKILLGVGAYIYPYNAVGCLKFTKKTQNFFNNLDAIYVRDFASKEALSKIGVPAPMLGCPSFGNLSRTQANSERLIVGITAPARPEYLHDFMQITSYFKALGYEVKFLFNSGLVKTPFMGKRLQNFVNFASANGEVVNCEGSLTNYTSALSSCSVHFGFRLHGHVFALAKGIPSVLVAEDSRSVGLASIIDSTYLVPEHTFDFASGGWLLKVPQRLQARINKPNCKLSPKILEYSLHEATQQLKSSRELMEYYRLKQIKFIKEIILK